MPPHDTYIECQLGGVAIMQRKPPARHSIGIDRDGRALERFACNYPVKKIHGCAHQFLAMYPFTGRELVYSDPPYFATTRTSERSYRYDYTERDHVELLALLTGLPGPVIPLRLPLGLVRRAFGGVAHAGTTGHEPGQDAHREAVVQLHPGAVVLGALRRQELHRDRQRIKRKAENWARPLPEPAARGAERLAMLVALMAVEAADG
jgi:hypothetical protein